MERLAVDLGIRREVEFRGYVGELSKLYSTFDLFVLSTRFEGQPLVLLEAMHYALPIVATDLSPIRETLGSPFSRYLTRPGDANGMAKAITRLIDSPDERIAVGNAGHERVGREFDLTAWCRRLLGVYDSIMSRSRAPRGSCSR